MTTPYNQHVGRTGGYPTNAGGTDPLIPQPMVAEIIQSLPTQCATLGLARMVPMSTTTQRQPVLDLLPTAYFVSQTSTAGPDQGWKQATQMAWKGVNLIVEEIACIVPIPDSYLADAAMPIWPEVKPRLVEAIGQLIDGACLFDVNRPATWGVGLVPAAIAAGNVQAAGSGTDIPQEVAMLGEKLTKMGVGNINGFGVRPGFGWRLAQIRSAQGLPIYDADLQNGGAGGRLLGLPAREIINGAWDPTLADLLMGDWSKAIVGMRSDISFKMFDQGVISDPATGQVVWNAMQQDGVAMRVTMRMAWATARPTNALRKAQASSPDLAGGRGPFYFGVLQAPSGQMS